MSVRFELTQVPVRQCIIVVVLIVVNVFPFLALPAFVLQSDGAGLVETRLDVLLTIWNSFILFNITLKDIKERTGSTVGFLFLAYICNAWKHCQR